MRIATMGLLLIGLAACNVGAGGPAAPSPDRVIGHPGNGYEYRYGYGLFEEGGYRYGYGYFPKDS